MQTSLRPVAAPGSAGAAVGYQYYQPHHHEPHLELMPDGASLQALQVDEAGLNINHYRQYDNYHHHQHQQQQPIQHQQQVSFLHQEPICYTSLGEPQRSHQHQQPIDEPQVVVYDTVEPHQHYQLLEAPQRAGPQQVVVEVERPVGELYQQHLLPEQQPQQQQASYQTIYYEPASVIEQPLIEQHHQAAAFGQLPGPSTGSEAPEVCYHQFQYHQPLGHVPQTLGDDCGLALDAGQMAQVAAEPPVQATDPADFTPPTDTYLQPASFDDSGRDQEAGEQLQYRALELARVKNLSSTSIAGDYLQQQHQQQQLQLQESVETLSQPSTGMTHSAEHHHSLRHDHNHLHRHHRRDESLSSSASSTSSAASTSEESSASSLTRDERKAREANIPLSYYEIVNLSIEQFNEQLAKYSLSEAQLTLIKDIRRRGKNKVAAQSCRKRKMEQIFELQHEVQNLANKRRNLGFECGQLIKEHAGLVQEYDKVYAIIQERMHQSPQLMVTAASSPPQTATSSIT